MFYQIIMDLRTFATPGGNQSIQRPQFAASRSRHRHARGWICLPNFILESKEIPTGAKLTYAMLLKYAREDDEYFPGQDQLTKDMGNSSRSVVRYIAELEEVGLVAVKHRSLGRPKLYPIHIKASFWKKGNH
jgi:hypothetical protein